MGLLHKYMNALIRHAFGMTRAWVCRPALHWNQSIGPIPYRSEPPEIGGKALATPHAKLPEIST